MKLKFVWGIVLFSSVVNAQALPGPPANSDTVIVWNQFAPDQIALSTYTYKYYLSGTQAKGVALPAKCETAVTPYRCVAKLPIMRAGPFTIWITSVNSAGESAKSEFIAGVMQVSPPPVPNQPRLENLPQVPAKKAEKEK